MSLRMNTLGGVFSFTDHSSEVIETVKANLAATNYYDPNVEPKVGDISEAASWSAAFAGMKQELYPLTRGLYAAIGFDDLYYNPKPFLKAADEFIAPGSWIVYYNDNDDNSVHAVFKPMSGGALHNEHYFLEDLIDTTPNLDEQRKFAYDLLSENGVDVFAPEGDLPAWALTTDWLARSYARTAASA